ncbi:ribbon-helix-helix domain-containing protein [Paenibacillus sp. Pae108]|uniref:ribbon-helix-helix domain-containing protein n=1 Tax=Paenibacillus sp. Pae108 TaxID=2926019 RepID=UPI002119B29B|nr:ribbon-helix-helix domain-containing protein [Paenibacillus sp. Pae108]
MARIETQRIDIRVPVSLLEEIEKYQEEHSIPTRTTALLELVRLGLSETKKSKSSKKMKGG